MKGKNAEVFLGVLKCQQGIKLYGLCTQVECFFFIAMHSLYFFGLPDRNRLRDYEQGQNNNLMKSKGRNVYIFRPVLILSMLTRKKIVIN